MYIARIRRTPTADVQLAVRVVPGLFPGSDGDLLQLVPGLPADPVAVLAQVGQAGLAEAIGDGASGARVRAGDVVFEPPVARCSKICCLALNYASHAAEGGMTVPPEPVVFFKPPSALTGHRVTVVPPARTHRVEHEAELAVIIGRVTKDLPEARWAEAIAGYSVINDLTARDLQLASVERGEPWDRSKCFDMFAPLGPYLATPDEVGDAQHLDLRLEIDGQIRQEANTSQMVFALPRLISDLSTGMTLLPGDVIATGTTAGISPAKDGDLMVATVEHVGTLANRISWTAQ